MIIPELAGTTPWWTCGAIDMVAELVQPEWRVFEWGSGGSTLWFAQRVEWLTSVEHDEEWYKKTRKELEEYRLHVNTSLSLVAIDSGTISLGAYASFITSFPDGRFDLVSIDGRNRAQCIRHAIPKLKPGGYLVLDNSERAEYQDAMHLLDGWQRWDFDKDHGQAGYAEWRTTIWRQPE